MCDSAEVKEINDLMEDVRFIRDMKEKLAKDAPSSMSRVDEIDSLLYEELNEFYGEIGEAVFKYVNEGRMNLSSPEKDVEKDMDTVKIGKPIQYAALFYIEFEDHPTLGNTSFQRWEIDSRLSGAVVEGSNIEVVIKGLAKFYKIFPLRVIEVFEGSTVDIPRGVQYCGRTEIYSTGG